MPKKLTVGIESFDFPIEGDNPGYAEQVTDWATAVTDALKSVHQANDILTQSATINNYVTTPTTIPGFFFNTAQVITINGEYIVKRTTADPQVTLVESGFIQGNYDGTNWSISRRQIGDAGIDFTITSGGQIQYTSTELVGTNYTGTISFKAKVFNEA